MRARLCSQVAGRFGATAVFLFAFSFLISTPLPAQDEPVELVRGYVTATDLPAGFDVDGERISLQPLTEFRKKGSGGSQLFDDSLRADLKPGAYVWVLGNTKHKKAIASTVTFRQDWNQQISGLGPVNAVIGKRSEREFRADGFTILVPSSAVMTFRGDVHTLDEVGAGTWLHYKGNLDSRGVLVAASVDFLSTKPGKPVEVVNGLDDYKIPFFPPDFARHVDGRVKPGHLKSWHTVPADEALHDRLLRVGMKLIPAFQRELADDDPRKINFQFYAVNGDDLHTFICAPRGGLILYPRSLIERMQNDDQLAAALALPIAFILQRQGVGKEMKEWPAVRDQLSTLALYSTIPFFGALPLDLMGALPDHRIAVRLEEQVGRIAISLIADAGYDPWKAPEAFRLLAAKRLPDQSLKVKHTNLSGYALSILNLEYRSVTSHSSEEAEGSHEAAR
jgi:hypothetical protein